MATLVLSTVGTVLGGPVGGAIGSLVGQSIDQQILGPGPREGPRLGDLAVQSSSYGSPIPRIYGTMRVAGSIIWSTDLKEDSQTTGAKGQPDSTTYSYSVSFAVALSSRPVEQIGRIWADGKLLRGVEGDFKIPTEFRFLPGDEDQAIDPLIASIEGIEATPAYRGTALAIFENLQLAEFGNRIPFLTFEVLADVQPAAIADILTDSSGGIISTSKPNTITGYAAYADDMEASLRPLVEQFGVELFDDGANLCEPTDAEYELSERELGCTADDSEAPPIERSQLAARSLPSVLALSYYDPARDYQVAQARASVALAAVNVEAEQVPAVLQTEAARGLAESTLARRWAHRDVLKLRLPPSQLPLEPGMSIRLNGEPDRWTIKSITIDSMIPLVELTPVYSEIGSLVSDPGRVLPTVDELAEPTLVAAAEMPAADDETANTATVIVGTATAGGRWRPVPVRIESGGWTRTLSTSRMESIFGSAQTILPPGQSALFDQVSTVEVVLCNGEQWLESRDDDALGQGANLALLGRELIQFGDAIALSPGRFRLRRLLRGRRGTEWAMDSHEFNETFVLLDGARLQSVDIDPANVGTSLRLTPGGIADRPEQSIQVDVNGEALRPPSPVHLTADFDADGSLRCRWTRRSRSGWAWLDEVDAPLGCAVERYRVEVSSAGTSIELGCDTPVAMVDANALQAFGPATLSVSVRQIGDFAASRPSTINIPFEG